MTSTGSTSPGPAAAARSASASGAAGPLSPKTMSEKRATRPRSHSTPPRSPCPRGSDGLVHAAVSSWAPAVGHGEGRGPGRRITRSSRTPATKREPARRCSASADTISPQEGNRRKPADHAVARAGELLQDQVLRLGRSPRGWAAPARRSGARRRPGACPGGRPWRPARRWMAAGSGLTRSTLRPGGRSGRPVPRAGRGGCRAAAACYRGRVASSPASSVAHALRLEGPRPTVCTDRATTLYVATARKDRFGIESRSTDHAGAASTTWSEQRGTLAHAWMRS